MAEPRYRYLTKSFLEELQIPLTEIVHFEDHVYRVEEGRVSWKLVY